MNTQTCRPWLQYNEVNAIQDPRPFAPMVTGKPTIQKTPVTAFVYLPPKGDIARALMFNVIGRR